MKSDHFFSIFSRFSLFPQVFEQINEWPISKLHKMIRVLHVVVCLIIFILFHGRNWQGGVFKVMKNDYFLVLLAVWILSSKCFDSLRGDLR